MHFFWPGKYSFLQIKIQRLQTFEETAMKKDSAFPICMVCPMVAVELILTQAGPSGPL